MEVPPSDGQIWRGRLGDTSSSPIGPLDPLLSVSQGTLQRVIALGIADARVDRQLELLSVEIYDTGSILSFRATGARRIGDEVPWLTWACAITDDRATEYDTFSGGEGNSQLWRGQVLIHPAPPNDASELYIGLRCRAAVDESWTFNVSMR